MKTREKEMPEKLHRGTGSDSRRRNRNFTI